MAFVSAASFICEKVLLEKDNVPSLVRIVDNFMLPADGPLLPDGKRMAIGMTLFAQIRVTFDDQEKHVIDVLLTRPDGSEKTIHVANQAALPPTVIPGADRVFNVLAQIGVEPSHYGRHKFTVLFDSQTVASTTFFISLPPSDETNAPVVN